MQFSHLNLKGCYLIQLNPLTDERGYFLRTLDEKLFNDVGLNFKWVQENHSRSINKGIIRGLHFQLPPFTETKLIRCLRGKILDVFVDLRKDSRTFGQWDSVELSEDNFRMVLIPRGFAHGYCTLTEESEMVYKVDNYYTPSHEFGLLWNDVELNINWPDKNPILSEKDKMNLTLKEFTTRFNSIEVYKYEHKII